MLVKIGHEISIYKLIILKVLLLIALCYIKNQCINLLGWNEEGVWEQNKIYRVISGREFIHGYILVWKIKTFDMKKVMSMMDSSVKHLSTYYSILFLLLREIQNKKEIGNYQNEVGL